MNKFAKSKVVGITAASLAAVAVASVGFSAWVVTTLKGTTTEDIQVTVAEVKDESITLSDAKATYPTGTSGIVFDADSTNSGSILKASSDSKPQLEFGLEVKVTLGSEATFKGISAWMEIVSGNVEKITDNAETADMYVVSPIALGKRTTATGEGQTATTTWSKPDSLTTVWEGSALTTPTKDGKTANTLKTSKNFEFGWGKFFNSENPSKLSDSSKLKKYTDALTAMKDSPYKFKIHLELNQ